MKRIPYTHLKLRPGGGQDDGGRVVLSKKEVPNCPDVVRHATDTLWLAKTLGVDVMQGLVFPAPLLSRLCGRDMFLLRGWKEYESSIKGFNALGLLAEHAGMEQRKLKKLSPATLRLAKLEFLASRKVFSKAELAALSKTDLFQIDDLCLALWRAFAQRTIVCATSSNLGIALHQALNQMRHKKIRVAGKSFPLLKSDEGKLVIWCPDERADFMDPEKTAFLKSLPAEKPKRTALRTYINRQQRDPGALKEALACGGYFYPTNPQSRSELKNLLTLALQDLPLTPNVKRCLESLGAVIVGSRVEVRSALEGGMLAMACPYMNLLIEAEGRGDARPFSLWNPASIGAALAAMTLCDRELRAPRSGNGKHPAARIHGVFDIANLQSLAQLFGVVIQRHQSGRQTAYVGLGSSSYSNGNLCFDILRHSADKNGAFRGRDALHPATHSLNPIAQALIYGESLGRWNRKPEPAGAAALAGYLLARLDGGTLSFIEITYSLRLAGFSKKSFLKFCGFKSPAEYLQQSREEGAYMESLVQSVLEAMDRSMVRLRKAALAERARSRRKYRLNHLDDKAFEAKNPAAYIHLTGDNCVQPDSELAVELFRNQT